MNCNDCGGFLPRCDCSPFGGRKSREDDEAYLQFQRDRIEAARKHDAEQAKPKLTVGWCYAHGGPIGSAGTFCVCGRACGVAVPAPMSLTDKEILRIADSLPHHPWGIGSRHSDAIAFARAVLAAGVKEGGRG